MPLADLERRLGELPGDREVIAYCRGPLRAYAHKRSAGSPPLVIRRVASTPAGRNGTRGDQAGGASSMTTQTTARLDTHELEERVKRMYEEVALEPEREFHFETGRPLAERLGYPPKQLDRIPAAAIDSFAGVGHFLDLAHIRPGDRVLDLGSGSGMDYFLAALATGGGGQVVGVDMTSAQLDKARRLAAEASVANVNFRRGYIEDPPVEDATIDCVIANGVINPTRGRQSAAYREANPFLARGVPPNNSASEKEPAP